MERNLFGWIEIPVSDMARARAFYEEVFDVDISVHDLGGVIMGWFPFAEGKPGAPGSLVQHEDYRPSDTHGAVVYFSCLDVDNELSRVEAAGGKVTREKTEIGEGYGFMALCQDTEGNRIALHSNQ